MPEYPKTGEKTRPEGISELQYEAASTANNIKKESFSRSSFGTDALNDSVFYCARNFSINEVVDYDAGKVTESIAYPETLGGSHWKENPPVYDGVADFEVTFDYTYDTNSSIWHRQERRDWSEIPTHSSNRLSTLSDSSISTLMTTSDWLAGDSTQNKWNKFKSIFGTRLFNVPNEGRPFALYFHTDINLAHSLDNDHSLSPKEWARWRGGQRIWTSVIYVLKPSRHSTRVLVWSPGVGKFIVRPVKTNWASIDITHSYTDVVRINNDFIKQLCLASGIDYELHKMQLDGTSFFGWSVRSGLDRWDHVPRTEDDTELAAIIAQQALSGDFSGVVGLKAGTMSYNKGQHVHVNGGNVNFIAFKDYDENDNNRAGTSSPLVDASSLIQYGSDPSKSI